MRLAVTAIESFRLHITEDWMTEERLLGDLLGVRQPTPEMEAGIAFEAMLCDPVGTALFRRGAALFGHELQLTGVCASGDFQMRSEDVMQACAFIPELASPAAVWQVKPALVYDGHTVVGKVDLMHGLRQWDIKTTQGTVDPENYLDSCQWRFYLDMLAAKQFTYAVYKIAVAGDGTISAEPPALINQWPYVGLHDECRQLVGQFVGFLQAKGLEGHPRFQELAA